MSKIINSQYNVQINSFGNNAIICGPNINNYTLYMNMYMFDFANNCQNLKLNLDTFNVNYAYVTYMCNAFAYCYNITGSPVCGPNVIDMDQAFYYCNNLTGSPVCGPNVEDMSCTYFYCSNLTGSPVCGPNVTRMCGTYQNCSNLTGSPVCGNNVTDIGYAYSCCYNLTGNPVCGDNVTHMYMTYENCSNLTGSPVCGSNVIEMYDAYLGCYNLTGPPVCGDNVVYMYSAYENCSNLTGSPVCGNNVILMHSAYHNCTNLTGSPVCGPNVNYMYMTYYNCSNLTGSPVCGDKVTELGAAYLGCSNLTGSPVCGENVTGMYHTYGSCSNLTGSPVCGPNVTNMNYTYSSCGMLTGNPVCGDNVIDMAGAYGSCINLIGSPVCGKNVTNMGWAYQYCSNLTGSPVCGPNVTHIGWAYTNCSNLTGSPVCGDNVVYMFYAYYYCHNLTGSPECGNNVTEMSYAYAYCRNLTGSPVCGPNVTSMWGTYHNCYNLTGSPVCGPNVTNMCSTYDGCPNLSGTMYMQSDNVEDTTYMLSGHNSQNRINIIVNPNTTTNSTLYSQGVGCGSWTLDSSNNCYYNSAGNVYVYFGDIPTTTYSINVTSSLGGSVSGGGTYAAGATCTLTATPDDGYYFVEWEDLDTEELWGDNPYSFTVMKDMNIHGYFENDEPVYNMTWNLTNCTSNDTPSTITSEDDIYFTITPSSGYILPESITVTNATYNWNTGIDEYQLNIWNANGDVTVTINATEPPIGPFTITTSQWGSGTVTGAGTYNGGERCTLTATPADGYYFSDWYTPDGEGDWQWIGDDNPYSFTVICDNEFRASFEKDEEFYSMTWNLTNCTSDSTPATISDEDDIYFTITPNEGYILPSTITVTNANYDWNPENDEEQLNIYDARGDVTVTIDAIVPTGTFTITTNKWGKGTVTGAGTYNAGETCTLSATPAAGYYFEDWETPDEESLSSENPYSFTVTGDAEIYAWFAEDEPVYNMTWNLTNCTSNDTPSTIEPGDDLYFTITPDAGYTLPKTVTATNAEVYSWDSVTGELNIWQAEGDVTVTITAQMPEINKPLCFTANTAGSTVELCVNGEVYIANTAYSRDNITWTTFTPGYDGEGANIITLTNVGDKVYFRNDITGDFEDGNLYFVMTGSIAASGNCNSLYSSTNYKNLTTLSYYNCFCDLFRGCTSLTSAPLLPATKLSNLYSYSGMFYGCTSLIKPPTLPATVLDIGSYEYMFYGCTSLLTTPALPATDLQSLAGCYRRMFENCTSLTTVPALSAINLEVFVEDYGIYLEMFAGCTSLIISDTQTADAPYAWIIPTSGTFEYTTTQEGMFTNCAGVRSSDNLECISGEYKVYYTQNKPIGDKLYLYDCDNGSVTANRCIENSGDYHICYGWDYLSSKGYMSETNDYTDIGDTSTGYYEGIGIQTNNTIDVTNYSKLCIDGYVVSHDTGIYNYGFNTYLCSNLVTSLEQDHGVPEGGGTDNITSESRCVTKVDISNISGSYHIGWGCSCGALPENTTTSRIYKVWLE